MTGPSLASPDKETIRTFFNGIASCYDRVNSVLSFRLDEFWRRRAAELILAENPGPRLLDLGVGTGKFLREFLQRKHWEFVTGVDFAEEMLREARRGLPWGCALVQADIHDLPFEDQSFDLIVSSFTLRSVKERGHFFGEVRRVLRPGGRLAFLCLTRPTSRIGRALYAPYLKFYLPVIGGWISRDRNAYQFLSQSIQSFPSPPEVATELESLGFREIAITPLTFGLSTLITACHQ